jgi:hypothetical protein
VLLDDAQTDLVVKVLDIRVKHISEFDENEVREEGFSCREDLCQELVRIYGDIARAPNSQFWVVRFAVIR